MPNVTIEGPIDLRQIVIRRPEMFLRDPDGIKRVSEYYINTDCSKLLLEALVIEPGKKQQFFFQVARSLTVPSSGLSRLAKWRRPRGSSV